VNDVDVNGRIIFERIFKKYGVKVGTELKWLKIGHDDEISSSSNAEHFWSSGYFFKYSIKKQEHEFSSL
jgi:hypothetical protein